MHYRPILSILLASLWLGGCGGDARGPEPPPPGTVELLSDAQLDPVWYGPNRVINGKFERWTLGQAAPDDFQAPDSRFSQISNDGGAARQTWVRSDIMSDASSLFRTRIPLRSGVTYQVVALAETKGDGVASLSVWRVPDGGAPELVEPSVISLLPGEGLVKKYVRTLNVPEGGSYLLAAQATVEPEASFEVIWHRWQVTPVPEAP